jgi:hypothetical protein
VVTLSTLKEKAEEGEQETTTYKEERREDKTTKGEEGLKRVEEKKQEEKLPTARKLGVQILTKLPPQFQLSELNRVIKPIKEAKQLIPTPYLSLKTSAPKVEPLKTIKPNLLKTKIQPAQPLTITKKPIPETAKVETVKPLHTLLPTHLEKRVEIRKPKIEPQELTKVIPDVSQITTQELLPKPIEKESVSEEAKIAGVGERPPELSEDEIFIPPILEELSTATASMDRPVCIILSKKADDSFIYSVAVICREIYRIVKGGKPTPRWISEELRDEIERRLRAEDMIFIVDDSKSKLLPDFSKIRSCKELLEKLNLEIVEDRLREFFSQDFGFVIFHVNERWASTFANLLRKELGNRVNIIEVAPPKWELNTKIEVAKACWGFVGGEGGTFDDIFSSCENKFLGKLKEVLEDVELTHWLVRDENAGDEHEAMKGVVAECLARELGATRKDDVIQMLKVKVIETEHPLDGGRCDVYVAKLSRFVEIETFYGRGNPVIRLDNDTLKKYGGKRSVDIVLLTGIAALLYARRLIKLANVYRKDHDLEVNFYLPDLRDRKLIPLKQVFRTLESAIGTRRVEELTEDDVRRLWEDFSQALREGGKDPEKYREVFYLLLNRFETYQENLRRLLEEVKLG